jgi:general secretion pathway protein J
MRARATGFTLLEVMIAVALLGLIVLGLAQGLRFGLAAWDRQTRQIAARDDLGTADRLIRALIAQAEPAEEDEPPHLRGAAGAITLRTRLPLAAELAGIGDVEAALGVDAGHRLVLRATPHPNAAPLRAARPVIEEVLLADVDHIELSYWRPGRNGQPGLWQPSWRSADLPLLIRLRLVFLPGISRHWPDIIAAPLRDRAQR